MKVTHHWRGTKKPYGVIYSNFFKAGPNYLRPKNKHVILLAINLNG